MLVFPLQAFEGIVTLALPLALMGRALLHKDWWRSGQALIALISAYLLSALFTYLLQLPVFNQVHNGMISYRNLNHLRDSLTHLCCLGCSYFGFR